MKDISEVYEVKQAGKWVETYRTEHRDIVYERLTHDLVAKYLEKCSYIKSIRRTQNYDGTITITIYMQHGSAGAERAVYTIESH